MQEMPKNIYEMTPDERRAAIGELENRRRAIDEDIEATVALYVKESGNRAFRKKKRWQNPDLLDGSGKR